MQGDWGMSSCAHLKSNTESIAHRWSWAESTRVEPEELGQAVQGERQCHDRNEEYDEKACFRFPVPRRALVAGCRKDRGARGALGRARALAWASSRRHPSGCGPVPPRWEQGAAAASSTARSTPAARRRGRFFAALLPVELARAARDSLPSSLLPSCVWPNSGRSMSSLYIDIPLSCFLCLFLYFALPLCLYFFVSFFISRFPYLC